MHLNSLLVLADPADPVLAQLPPGLGAPLGEAMDLAAPGLVLVTTEDPDLLFHPILHQLRREGELVLGLCGRAPRREEGPPEVDLLLISPDPDRAAQIGLIAALLGRDPTLVRHLRELCEAAGELPVNTLALRLPNLRQSPDEAARSLLPPDGDLLHATLVLQSGGPMQATITRLGAIFGGVMHDYAHEVPELGEAAELWMLVVPLHGGAAGSKSRPTRPHHRVPSPRSHAQPPRVAAIEAVIHPAAQWGEPWHHSMSGGGGGAAPPPSLEEVAPTSAPTTAAIGTNPLDFDAFEHAESVGAAPEQASVGADELTDDPITAAPPPSPAPGPRTMPPTPSLPMISTLAEAFVQSGLPAQAERELVLRAGFRPPARGERGVSVVAETPEGTQVDVRVEASPADAAEILPERARVQLRPDGFSEMARFVVVPKAEGRLALRVSFDRGAENIAAVPIDLAVGTEAQPALEPPQNGDAIAARIGPPQDERYLLRLVVLSEQDDRELLRFEWTAPDFTGPRGAPHPLDASLRETCRGLYTRDRVASWYDWYQKKDQPTGERRVAQDGAQLANALLPPEVAAVLKALMEGGEPHMLEVEETRSTLVPWELLAFRLSDGAFHFLAETLLLARRPAGARQNRLRTTPVLVAGELSGREAGLAAPLGEVLPAVASSFDLDSLLFGPEARPLGVLYITAHGETRAVEDGGPKVWFPDGSALEPNQLVGTEALRGALVVMASCHAAEAQQGLLGDAGWVSQLKSVGAEAIIAPLWDVDRGRSEVFCEALFAALAAHKALGVAVSEGRAACRARGGPDWLAWTLWGDPTLRASP